VALPDAGTLLLIHNPRCSKSRAAKALLERGEKDDAWTAEAVALLQRPRRTAVGMVVSA